MSRTLPDKSITVGVDQTRKTVGTISITRGFLAQSASNFLFENIQKSVKLFGAVSDDRELFVTEVVDRFTIEITIRFLRALQDEFGEKIHVLLDNALYFKSQQVQEFIEETTIEVTYFRRESPDLNPVEECWRQLKQSLGNQVFSPIGELRPAISDALDQINLPEISDHLFRTV